MEPGRTGLMAGFLGVFLLAACAPVQLVTPYDETIYNGLTEYKAELNLHVKNMADLAGTPAGTYEANQLKYNAMETQLELMIDRARSQSTGLGCRLSDELTERVASHLREQAPPELVAAAPAGDAGGDTYGCTEILLGKVRQQLDFLQLIHRETDRCELRSPGTVQVVEVEVGGVPAAGGDLDAVVDQAVAEVIESLRASLTSALLARLDSAVLSAPATAGVAGQEVPMVSCLRPATAVDALAISNQSIDAAWFVENAKKQGVE